MLSVVINALKKSFIFLCTPFAKRCSIYSDWAFEMITAVSVIKRLCLYEFTIWGRDLVSVVLVIEFFFKKIYENLVRTLKTVRNIEVAVLERCLFREVRRTVYACQQSVSTETSTYTSRQHYIY